MLFAKIDVRENLLSNATIGGARLSESVEIRMDEVSRSKRALLCFSSGQAAMRTYRVQNARMSYANGIEAAREDRDPVMVAAGITLLSQLLDGMGPSGATLSSLQEARAVLSAHVMEMQEALILRRTKRDEALGIMQPRCDLLALIEHNVGQYELVRDTAHLHDCKANADRLISLKRGDTAFDVATRGRESACNILGQDHWWVAVMDCRRALALFLLGKHDELQKIAKSAIATFEEWSTSPTDCDTVFLVDYELMNQAVAGKLVIV